MPAVKIPKGFELCPACEGEGRHKEGRRWKNCLACKNQGFVEAQRCCRRCHKFIASCVCVHPNMQPHYTTLSALKKQKKQKKRRT